jgi:deoxyribodipyrimidine photolyase-related protein
MSEERLSIWILGDQLLDEHPALAAACHTHAKDRIGIVLVESQERTARLPYQRKKLVLLFSAMRHYGTELRQQGFTVDYRRAPTFRQGLVDHVAGWQPGRLLTMAASEYPSREFQQTGLSSVLGVPVTVLPNQQFLTSRYDPYPDVAVDKRVVMEHFYRRMRRHFGILLTDTGQPVGGEWNYDAQNRKPLPRNLEPPVLSSFSPDTVTREVMAEVQAADHGVGTVAGFDLAVTRHQALDALEDFVATRLPNFGPYEDAMSSRYRTLYHSVLSPYLNTGLLEPLEVIRAAEQAYEREQAPINSVEGFVRQILGWREYMYWQYWRLMPDLLGRNAWDAHRPLPQFFWDGQTEMSCLHHAIGRTIETGYTHHIERLMLLCNFCLLAGIEPAAANEWFLSFYVDAYEWVMAPNVIGMGLNADGGLIGTKPYIASANYINRMSDYCPTCRYDHKQRTGANACPFNFLYWHFLLEHEAVLRANPRLGRNVLGLRHLDEDERDTVRRQAQAFLDDLIYHEA